MKYGKQHKVFAGVLTLFIALVLVAAAHAKLSVQDIEGLRAELAAKGATFTVGLNAATERDLSELCGLIPPPKWWEKARFRDIRVRATLPTSWNWCDQGGCTPVKDQGSCGSCWAFGTVGPLESNILIQEVLEEDLAEQYLLSCNTDGWDCSGGWWAHDYHEWKYSSPETEAGAVPEDEFPYVAYDSPCGGPYSHPYKIDDWAYIGNDSSVPSVDAIKQAILDYGPVSVGIYVGRAFQAYTGGIFNTSETGVVNHAVVLVGWDDTQGTDGVWFLRNSWSSTWGESGYMRIEYGTSQVGYSANYVVYSPPYGFHLSTPTPAPLFSCAPDSLEIPVDVESKGGFSDPVALTVSGLPSGVEGLFDVNPVTPPGSSTLTLTVEASASPGAYDFEVQGLGGGQSHALPLTLHVGNTAPDPPSLSKPANGEPLGGYANIAFAWSPVTGASGYHLQVDDDPSFLSPEADIPSIPSNSYTLAGPLTIGQTFYWRVSAENACGEGAFSEAFWFVANPKKILLVDDDDNEPDVRPYYETALSTLGYSYEVWDTAESDNEPGAADLSPYEMVIWFTGALYGGPAGPGAAGESALAAYLNSGGKLFITSQDYHYDKGFTPFMQNYLGADFILDDMGWFGSISGVNQFDGLGPYSLNYPFVDYADIIIPGTGAASFAELNIMEIDAGLYTNNTVFLVLPWEAIANSASQGLQSTDGNEMLQAVITYLTQPNMVVTPQSDFDSTGGQGGPFAPDRVTYRIQNNGASAFDYRVSKTAIWLTLDDGANPGDGPLVGNLLPGQHLDIAVIIDTDAQSLSPGAYADTVIFTNMTSGSGTTSRSVNLTVLAAPCEGNFDSDGDVDGSDLAIFAADFGRTDCANEPLCEGDFDSDGDVDGSDLAIFAADFGRTDCPVAD